MKFNEFILTLGCHDNCFTHDAVAYAFSPWCRVLYVLQNGVWQETDMLGDDVRYACEMWLDSSINETMPLYEFLNKVLM